MGDSLVPAAGDVGASSFTSRETNHEPSPSSNETRLIDIEDLGDMVQGRIIKRLLGQGSGEHSQDTSNSYDPRPSPSFARPASSQEAQLNLGSPLTSVDISPDATRAVVAGDRVFKTLEVNGSHITEQYDLRAAIRHPGDGGSGSSSSNEPSRISHIRWSHGELETTIITAATSGRIATYDLNRLNSGFEVGRITENKRQVHKLSINPLRGNLLLTAGQDGSVKFFDIKVPPGRASATFSKRSVYAGNSEAIRDVKWSPIRGFEFACSTANGAVVHWDTRNHRVPLLKISAHDGACLSISWHPDGEHILSGGLDHQCYVWDLSKDAGKRQKPKYSFSTPAPVSIVSWRPSSWSGSAQALRTSQVVTVYNDENSLKTQNSTINVWDIARPGLPWKEITSHETSPVGMQWQTTDMLWTVSREGLFRQNDLAYAPKVIDRKSLSEFALSPAFETLGLLEERQQKPQRHQPPLLITPHEKPPQPRSRLSWASQTSSGTQLLTSRSDSEEDTTGSFLGPKIRLKKKKKSPSRSRTTTQPDLTVLKLEDSLRAGGQYTPGQTLLLGPTPGSMKKELFDFLSNSYFSAITDDLREAEQAGPDGTLVHIRVMQILNRFAEAADEIGHFRLKKTWEALAYVSGLMLQRRAEYHRQQRFERVEAKKKEREQRERKHLRNSQRPEHLRFLHDRTPTKTPRPGSIQEKSGNLRGSNVAKTLLHEEESTSTMTTPLARPVGEVEETSHTRQPLLRLESDDFKLPPSSLHVHSNVRDPYAWLPTTNLQPPTPSEETITPKPSSPSRSPRRSPLRKPSRDHHLNESLEEGYDFYDLDALHNVNPSTPAIDIASPMVKKAPLKLDMPPPVLEENPDRPGPVLRHDSNESFAMFSTSADSPYHEVPSSLPRSTPKHHARDNEIGASHDTVIFSNESNTTENNHPVVSRHDTSFRTEDGGNRAAFGMQSTGLQSSDFDSSWDSGGHESRMRSLGAGWDSMGSDTADELSTSAQSRHHNPYFGEHALVPPRSVPPVDVDDTDDTDHDNNQDTDRKFPTHAPTMFEDDDEEPNPNQNISFEFPSTGAQTPHGTVIDESNPQIIDQDYLPQEGDPPFIAEPLDPHILVPRQIDYFCQNNHPLHASFLILTLGVHLMEGSMEEDRNAAILAQYHRRLEGNELFVLASLIRKLSYPTYPLVFSAGRAAQTGEVVYWCDTEGCGGRLKKAGLRVGESVKRCERCRQALEGCAVCGGHERHNLAPNPDEEVLGAQRIWITCQGCGHGGHEACLTAWHSASLADVAAEPEAEVDYHGEVAPRGDGDVKSAIVGGTGGEWSTDMDALESDQQVAEDVTEHNASNDTANGFSEARSGIQDQATIKLEMETTDEADEAEGICPLAGCLHPCLPGPWRRQHMAKLEAKKAESLSRKVRSELDLRGTRSGRASRRNSGDGGSSRVKADTEEAGQSKAVDALRFGERDVYREQKEAERARDRERERRKSVKFMMQAQGE